MVHRAGNDPMSVSVVIATKHRPDDLQETLETIAKQTFPPMEVIVVDASDDDRTLSVTEAGSSARCTPTKIWHVWAERPGAGVQRNQGAELAAGRVLCFLDDDVILEPTFMEEIVYSFDKDAEHRVGGVMGIITNQTYGRVSWMTWLFYCVMAGKWQRSFDGRVIGPAINLLPIDTGVNSETSDVDWCPSCVVAYRKEVFDAHRFPEQFVGYSFAEDLYLSAKVAKSHRLVCNPRARLYHKDLGGATHKDWVAIGRMQVVNRWTIMREVLEKRRMIDSARFIVYQIWITVGELKNIRSQNDLQTSLARWKGRAQAVIDIFVRRSRRGQGATA